MYQPASFSVGSQHAQPDENTGYNTQPSFVILGSKAAERNARRKKGIVPVLQTVPDIVARYLSLGVLSGVLPDSRLFLI